MTQQPVKEKHSSVERSLSFYDSFRHECLAGSGIAPTLYQAAIEIRADVEATPYGDVETPIHDALNWTYTRFGSQAKASFSAAIFLNENGDCWQAKLSRPRFDRKQTKPIKYETPSGQGTTPYIPPVPVTIRQRIAERYDIEVPLFGSFWSWVKTCPDLPLLWTEGGKKALSLLSQGYVAIALYGVNGGYRNEFGVRTLLPNIEPFIQDGRQQILVFDQDAKQKTRRRVNTALIRFGRLINARDSPVAIAHWDGKRGKGIDDFIVNAGVEAAHDAIASALPLNDWILWQRLDAQLNTPATLQTHTADLSSLAPETMPSGGIIAIASSKGTGKTKLQSQLVDAEVGAIAPSHRVTLSRNFCHRLGLDYRGDITGTKQTGTVTDGVYRIGIGLCVDALLSINPEHFVGRDLFIDEVVQVLRHLLTSSTCAKDGKRPALLARFHALVKVARRVIVADADLNTAVLRYLQDLREDDVPIFLIQNAYQPPGYPVDFIEAPDRTVITQRLLYDVSSPTPGKAYLVVTDSKSSSKTLSTLLENHRPGIRVLLINSETSSGPDERSFIENPDAVLRRGDYDVIIASPSMATGVSIEAQDVIERVYGVFTGVSSTDADMAQALGRVRQPIERVVWCTRVGSNYSSISRSTNPLELKSHLQSQTSASISLIRAGLKEDTIDRAYAYDWQYDPHLNLFVKIEAERNQSMRSLRDALRVRLRHEGHTLTIQTYESNEAIKLLLKEARDELKQVNAESIANARDLTFTEISELESRDHISPADQQAIAKYWLKEFYCLETVTVDDGLWDNEGRRRIELAALEQLLNPDIAIEKTTKSLEKQIQWNCGNTPWDWSQAALRQKVREVIGLKDFLDPDKWWTKLDLRPYAERIRQHSDQVRVALHFTVVPELSDVQLVHQLLSQMGVKITSTWSRSIPGLEGQKSRIYQIDCKHWQALSAVLIRRQQRRKATLDLESSSGSPPCILDPYQGGDPRISLPAPSGQWAIGDVVRYGTSLGQWIIEDVTVNDKARIRILSKWASQELLEVPLNALRASV
ncbi:MAG: plasmid replication protein, CyRepA1 family [Cyanobacteria bacterium P01_A01_bin.37]